VKKNKSRAGFYAIVRFSIAVVDKIKGRKENGPYNNLGANGPQTLI